MNYEETWYFKVQAAEFAHRGTLQWSYKLFVFLQKCYVTGLSMAKIVRLKVIVLFVITSRTVNRPIIQVRSLRRFGNTKIFCSDKPRTVFMLLKWIKLTEIYTWQFSNNINIICRLSLKFLKRILIWIF